MTDPYSQQVPPPNDGRVYAPQYRAAPPSSPASITALGVIGTVLGGLGLVVQALGLLALAVPALREAMVGAYGPGYQPLVWVNAAVFGLVTVALLAGSIGCLRRAEWGRRLLVGWAAVYPVVALAGTLLSVLYYIPMTRAHPAGTAAAAGDVCQRGRQRAGRRHVRRGGARLPGPPDLPRVLPGVPPPAVRAGGVRRGQGRRLTAPGRRAGPDGDAADAVGGARRRPGRSLLRPVRFGGGRRPRPAATGRPRRRRRPTYRAGMIGTRKRPKTTWVRPMATAYAAAIASSSHTGRRSRAGAAHSPAAAAAARISSRRRDDSASADSLAANSRGSRHGWDRTHAPAARWPAAATASSVAVDSHVSACSRAAERRELGEQGRHVRPRPGGRRRLGRPHGRHLAAVDPPARRCGRPSRCTRPAGSPRPGCPAA